MVMRLSGLSSGMDVDSMVKQLMNAERLSQDKLIQNKTLLEWKKSDYSSIYKAISDFRNTVYTNKLTSTLGPKAVTSNNEAAVTATANADAADMQHTISVTKLADVAKLTSTAPLGGTNKTSLNTQLGLTGNITFQVGDGTNFKQIELNAESNSIYDLVSKINNANLNIRANYDTTLDRFYLYTTKTGADTKIDLVQNALTDGLKLTLGANDTKKQVISTTVMDTTKNVTDTLKDFFKQPMATAFSDIADKTFDMYINDKKISVDLDTDTMSSLLTKINTSGAGVTASYDRDLNKFMITDSTRPNDTITTSELNFTSSDTSATDFMKNYLKFNPDTDVKDITYKKSVGQDAEFTLDNVTLKQPSNSFTISGVSYNLKAETGSTVTLKVSSDVDTAVKNVKAFIDAYNTFLEKINNKVAESRYSDYRPLTDAQKKEMNDDDIKAWEAKAKSGLLNRDSALSNLISTMRQNFSSPVTSLTGTYTSASSIGITTGNYKEGGKLYLDENKLRAAIQADPEVLRKVFSTDGDTTTQDGKTVPVTSTQGIAERLYVSLKKAMDSIALTAGTTASSNDQSFLGKQIKSFSTRISKMEDRLLDIENRYYKQFTAMEEAMQKMNSQSMWLSQQFSNG
ncbi:flagellar filament capping protein FliD [Heliophilum fasciatum]|uniref:Flagellar hook-associated protein 2 n=1 Tax=Heliophilum fasciatum TaxID=35700 RepID=A0A4R2RJS1_9FIRM|nr:flagellar filament capping protein FliD [Heliophilum fasciatum]MCW2278802.1 flagellar hook-associated protein 2 [Heliophilum fasciatum]TCP64112.1 flagellar hook-associated protein 2 [Heliophilum fasciatum]